MEVREGTQSPFRRVPSGTPSRLGALLATGTSASPHPAVAAPLARLEWTERELPVTPGEAHSEMLCHAVLHHLGNRVCSGKKEKTLISLNLPVFLSN